MNISSLTKLRLLNLHCNKFTINGISNLLNSIPLSQNKLKIYFAGNSIEFDNEFIKKQMNNNSSCIYLINLVLYMNKIYKMQRERSNIDDIELLTMIYNNKELLDEIIIDWNNTPYLYFISLLLSVCIEFPEFLLQLTEYLNSSFLSILFPFQYDITKRNNLYLTINKKYIKQIKLCLQRMYDILSPICNLKTLDLSYNHLNDYEFNELTPLIFSLSNYDTIIIKENELTDEYKDQLKEKLNKIIIF